MWDTSGVQPGTYSVWGFITDSHNPEQYDRANGLVTIQSPNVTPTLDLTNPSSNVTVTQGQDVTIGWTATDPDDVAAMMFFYDPDTDSTPWDGTNHQALYNTTEGDGSGQYVWDTSGVQPGTYSIWGFITDSHHPEQYDRAEGLVTVTEGIRLEVPFYYQPTGDWCWAASAAMMLEYYGQDWKPETVAADDHFNAGPDEGLSRWDVDDLEDFFEDNDDGASDGWYRISGWTNLSVKNIIISSLQDKHPLWVASISSEHAVVVTGYNGENNDDLVFWNDPSAPAGIELRQETWSGFLDWADASAIWPVKIIHANTGKVPVPSSTAPASIQLRDGDTWFVGHPSAGNLKIVWDGQEPYPGYYYKSNPPGARPDGTYGEAATQADALKVLPDVVNCSTPARSLSLRIRYNIRPFAGGEPVVTQLSAPFTLGPKESLDRTWTHLQSDLQVSLLPEGRYSFEAIIEDSTSSEVYDVTAVAFDVVAADYHAASPLHAGFAPSAIHSGEQFSLFLDIENTEPVPGGEFTTRFYASENTVITGLDYLIAEDTSSGIGSGGVEQLGATVAFPSDIPMGTYYVGWVIEANDKNQGNNSGYIPGQTLTVLEADIDVELPGQPDDVHSYPFGNVEVGDSISRQFTVRNEGNEAVVVSGLSGLDSPFAASMANTTIQPGQTETLTVTYSPQSEGAHSDTLIIHSNDPDESAYEIALTGTGVPVVPGDQYEDDDAASRATVIPTDGTPQEHTIHVGSDVDWGKFTLAERSHVTVETDGPSGDTRMWLYGPDSWSNEIEYDDDGGASLWSRIVRSGGDALDPGTYYVKIDEYGNNDVIDSYTISVTAAEAVAPTANLSANTGAAQRSMLTSFTADFSEDVSASISVGDLVVRNVLTDESIAVADMAVAYDATHDKATWTFPGLPGGSLPDGNWEVSLLAAGVADAAGNSLDGNGDGTEGDNCVISSFRFFGDADGDRDVDFLDVLAFRRTNLKNSADPDYDPRFDSDSDGDVDFLDVLKFRQNNLDKLEVPFDIMASTESLTVPEGSSAGFDVSLSAQPLGTVIVTTARTSGDEDLTVAAGGTLAFDSTNWDTPQTVTLAAAEDEDALGGSAQFAVSAAGAIAPVELVATEADNDLGAMRVAVINPDYYRILKHGVLYNHYKADPNDDEYVSVADGTVADGGTNLFDPANWSGVGDSEDFIGSILESAGYDVDYFEAVDLPAIDAEDYEAVFVQDPLRENIRQFDKDAVEAGTVDLLEYVGSQTFLDRLDAYVDSGGRLVLVGDAVRLLENGTGRLNYGKTVTANNTDHVVSQPSDLLSDDWLFIRGNPFCGTDRDGSGTLTVAASSLLAGGETIGTLTLHDGSDLPRGLTWSETVYAPTDGVSLLDARAQGTGEYVLDGSTCSPTEYSVTVDEVLNSYMGYTYSPEGQLIFYIGSDAFFDYQYRNYEGTWHTGDYMEIAYAVSSAGKSLVADFVDVEVADRITAGWTQPGGNRQGLRAYPVGSQIATSDELILKTSLQGAGVLTGDVDGDGLLETVATSGDQLRIYAEDMSIQTQVTMPGEGHVTMVEDVNGDGIADIGIGGGGDARGQPYFYDGFGSLLQTFNRTVGYDGWIPPVGVLDGDKILIAGNAGYSRDPRGLYVYDFAKGAELWGYDLGQGGMLQPSIADIDDDGLVDFGDFSYFSPAFLHFSGESEPPYAWWADFDKSGWVDFGDFSYFVTAFMKPFCDPSIAYPPWWHDTYVTRTASQAMDAPATALDDLATKGLSAIGAAGEVPAAQDVASAPLDDVMAEVRLVNLAGFSDDASAGAGTGDIAGAPDEPSVRAAVPAVQAAVELDLLSPMTWNAIDGTNDVLSPAVSSGQAGEGSEAALLGPSLETPALSVLDGADALDLDLLRLTA